LVSFFFHVIDMLQIRLYKQLFYIPVGPDENLRPLRLTLALGYLNSYWSSSLCTGMCMLRLCMLQFLLLQWEHLHYSYANIRVVNAATFSFWRADNWTLSQNGWFSLDDDGILTVLQTGLYMIYAQVIYSFKVEYSYTNQYFNRVAHNAPPQKAHLAVVIWKAVVDVHVPCKLQRVVIILQLVVAYTVRPQRPTIIVSLWLVSCNLALWLTRICYVVR